MNGLYLSPGIGFYEISYRDSPISQKPTAWKPMKALFSSNINFEARLSPLQRMKKVYLVKIFVNSFFHLSAKITN